MMKILVVEDETIAQKNIINILAEIDSSTEVIGSTESVTETVEWLQSNPAPDLIFMDIHLSDGPAFDIMEKVRVTTPIIFITAYDEYALQAFRANAIDYLLKPINPGDVRRALDKFREMTSQWMLKYVETIADFRMPKRYSDRLLVTSMNRLIPIDVSTISFIYTSDDETTIYLSDQSRYKYVKTLDSIVQVLDPEKFFRANKQYVLAKSKIKEILVWPDNRLAISMDVKGPEPVFISKNKASSFRKWIAE